MLIYPYRAGSKGVNALAKALKAKKIKLQGSKMKGRADKIVINWGNGSAADHEVLKCRVLNHPEAVSRAADKLQFFRAMAGKKLTPPFCTTLEEAKEMVKKGPVVCRTVLQGHSGVGIVIANKPEELVRASLYVKYIKKSKEFRVHVVGSEVVDTQRKARRKDLPDSAVNWQVRNHQNGFIYARGGVDEWAGASQLEQAAIATVTELGLDFGAVDIIWNKDADRYWVLEVNTAPGLEGQTVNSYANAFKGLA